MSWLLQKKCEKVAPLNRQMSGRPPRLPEKRWEALIWRGEPTEQEAKEAREFTERDPKDKGNRKVKFQKERSTIYKDYKQQDMLYLLTELKAAMASPEKAAALRRRLRKGVEWDKENKTWKLKEEK